MRVVHVTAVLALGLFVASSRGQPAPPNPNDPPTNGPMDPPSAGGSTDGQTQAPPSDGSSDWQTQSPSSDGSTYSPPLSTTAPSQDGSTDWPTKEPSVDGSTVWPTTEPSVDGSTVWPTMWPAPTSMPVDAPTDSPTTSNPTNADGEQDNAPVEYYFPDIDESIGSFKRQKFDFDPMSGFSLSTTDSETGVEAGRCTHPYCVHVVFESDYGAMSVFDAFYLDSYESVGGPVGTDSFVVGGPAPLVLGRFSKESIARLGENWADVFNWNDTRRTTWTFYPTTLSPFMNEIDLTLSLKQVYMALPDYNKLHADINNMGPLYSESLTDQVVIRFNALHKNAYTSASAMLPVVVNHAGSQLVDINVTATRLYPNTPSDSNEIQLTVKFGRRKYGGIVPWMPVTASSTCFNPPSWLSACPEASSMVMRAAMEDLLSHKINAIDMRPIIKMCAARIPASVPETNPPQPETTSTPPETMSPPPDTMSPGLSSSGSSTDDDSLSGSTVSGSNGSPGSGEEPTTKLVPGETPPPPPVRRLSDSSVVNDRLRDLEASLRLVISQSSFCAFNDITMKSDGLGVTLRHEPATTRIDFGVPSFNFYLVLQIDEQTVTTPVFTSGMSTDEIQEGIYSVYAVGQKWLHSCNVRFSNNTNEVEDVKRANQKMMDDYEEALQWSVTWAPPRDSSSSGILDSSRDSSASGSAASSTAGGESSGFTPQSSNPLADTVLPQKPVLQPVPAAKYSVFIEFSTLVQVPHVVAVYSPGSSMAPSISTNDGKLRLETVPLLQLDAKYTPPPEDVDLEWHVEPLWKTQARALLRKLSLRFSCHKCLKSFESCLLHEDCVYGVNSYFGEAVRSQRWGNDNDTVDTEIDVSEIIRQARIFFPGRGFEKLQELLLCWAKQACDLNAPPIPVLDEATGKWTTPRASHTVLVFEPSRLEIPMKEWRDLTVFANGAEHHLSSWTCSPRDFEVFLLGEVLREEPWYVRDVTIQDDCVIAAMNESQQQAEWEHQLTWNSGFIDLPRVSLRDSIYTGSSQYGQEIQPSVARPWSLKIKTSAVSPVADGVAPWSQLLSWLDVFRNIPFGATVGSNDTTNSNSNPIPSPVLPPPVPSAVCPACADALLACVSNAACASAAQAWLAWVLPGPSINATTDWDGFTRLRWLGDPFSNDSISADFRDQVLDLVACLAKNSCAVGYNRVSTQSEVVVPTTLRLRANRKIVKMDVATSADPTLQVTYRELPPVVLHLSDDPRPFVDQIKATYDEDISSLSGSSWVESALNFTGSVELLERLNVSGYNPRALAIRPDTYTVRFQTPLGAKPSWSYLLDWFGVDPNPRHNDTLCATCIPKLQACYKDSYCWQEVQTNVLPVLQRKQGWLQLWWEFVSDGHTRYKADLGASLSNNAYVTGTINDPNNPTATVRTSRWLYMDIFRCLAASKCDVSVMDSAVEPPATAYAPAYLKFAPATMVVLLYPDTTLSYSTWNGPSTTYLHTGSMADFTAFLSNMFGGNSDGIFSIVEPDSASHAALIGKSLSYEVVGPGASVYNVTFSDTFVDWIPWVEIKGPGKMPMATSSPYYLRPFVTINQVRLTIESMNQWPQWDRLINMLSVPPPNTSDFLSTCETAEGATHGCADEYAYNCKEHLMRSISAIQAALRSAKPAYNRNTGLFEVDLASAAPQYDTAATTSYTSPTFLKRYEIAAQCGAVSSPFGSRPTFQRGSVRFSRPNVGPLVMWSWNGNSISINDQDMTETEFRDFVATNSIFQSRDSSSPTGGYVSRVSVVSWIKTEDHIEYELDTNWIGSGNIKLEWVNGETNDRLEASSTPTRMGFQSEAYNVYATTVPWLNWLKN